MARELPFGEVFGFVTSNSGTDARRHRKEQTCPFQEPDTRCWKAPLGICSYADENNAITVCPKRFLQDRRLLRDVGEIAFGKGARIVAVPEVHVLRVNNRRVGKIDYLIVKVDKEGKLINFAALEVQSVYKSGKSVKSDLDRYIRTGRLPIKSGQRPDFRSSAQKRLMPQLFLKIPAFRAWGRKFFVAVDESFFSALPDIREEPSFANSEVTWLVYPFVKKTSKGDFRIGNPRLVFTSLDEVQTALREGVRPEPEEILLDCQRKINAGIKRSKPLLFIDV